ncbi:MAG: hypothetical protein WBB45_00845 [Cyclobacteriaceae bacterium]
MRIIVFLLLLLPATLFAQSGDNPFGLKNPETEGTGSCDEFTQQTARLPPDFNYGIYLRGREILVYFRTQEAFLQLFDNKWDGLAIDIVERRQFRCEIENSEAISWAFKGNLMEPKYRKELLSDTETSPQKHFFVKFGMLPSRYEVEDIELNLLVVQKKFMCEYRNSYNIEAIQWSLLDMGLYRDSPADGDGGENDRLLSKVLKFTVPFDKNQVVFDKEDIQPLYDSLNLTNYNVKEISIRAYASVEGPLEKNLELQQGRANSIIAALQSYQTPEIESTVVTNENWVELSQDIRGTEYGWLASKSKEEVKKELTKPEVLNALEPMLSRHRKALIELKLQKKFTEAEGDPVLLKKFFGQSIEENNLQEALYIQNIAYELIKDEKLPGDFLRELEVPNTTQYGMLLNNRWVFEYELNGENVYQGITAFEELLRLLPDNPKVLYNLTSLKLKAWVQDDDVTNRSEIEGMLEQLQKAGTPKELLIRMQINFKIILVARDDMNMNYSRKRANLRYISSAYLDLELEDADLLSLAKFMSLNEANDMAREVVEMRAYDVDASEDLIFFYLNLTIIDTRMEQNKAYRTLMLNAIEKDLLRFCGMFRSRHVGGVTFQLLAYPYLKSTYCESCSFTSSNTKTP